MEIGKNYKPINGIPEPEFQFSISFYLDNLIKRFFKKKKKMGKTLVEIALAEYGTKEIEGPMNNMDIVHYAKESGFDWVNDDETPWCAIFINWVAMMGDYERTHTALARDWLNVGTSIIKPEIGDIVVFWRSSPDSWKGHVGIFINEENNLMQVLGGNQSDQVNISKYSKNKILGYRRLIKKA